MTDIPIPALISAAEPAPAPAATLPARPVRRNSGDAAIRLCRWRDATTPAARLRALGINTDTTPLSEN